MGGWMCKRDVPPKVLLFGLHSVGKTTLLYRQLLGVASTTAFPITLGVNLEVVNLEGKQNLSIWDVGGRSKIRFLYRFYLCNTAALVFVVDSLDREGMSLAFEELIKSFLSTEEGQDTVCMVLANKQDKDGAMTVPEVEDSLRKALGDKNWTQTIFVCPVSAITGEGVSEAFRCFVEQMELKKGKNPTRGLISVDYKKRSDDGPNDESGVTTTTTYMAKKFLKDPASYIKSLLFY